MNSSKRGSSPRARRSSISLRAASMSFMRARSPGCMPSTADDTWSRCCWMTCWRSRSTRSSNLRCAAADSKSYDWSDDTRPARSSGRRSSWMPRSAADACAVAARRSSPDARASSSRRSISWRSSSTMSASSSAISLYTPPRSPLPRISSRRCRSRSMISRSPSMRPPSGPSMPSRISRASALAGSPWYSRSSPMRRMTSSASSSKPRCVPSQRE